MRMKNRKVSLEGCLLGTAIGDAIGLPFEGLSRQRISRLVAGPLKHRFFFGKGMISDDTEHTCMVAQSLIASKGEPTRFRKQLARRLRWWLLGLPAGIGLATSRSILKLWLGVSPEKSGVWSAGNGPAMRSAIIGVYAGDDGEKLKALVTQSTLLTHRDPKALRGALLVAQFAAYNASVEEFDREKLIEKLSSLYQDDATMQDLVQNVIRSVNNNESAQTFCQSMGWQKGVSGYIYQTVPVALHIALRHPHDYQSAITEVVMCGGDTDTVAAIVGGMVGAGCGRIGIPDTWINNMMEWPRSINWMTRLANNLVISHDDPESSKPLNLNIPAVLLRNMFFMCWVLLHGFRRLLPPY